MAKYTQKRRRRYAICRNRRKTKYSGGGQSNPRTTTSEAVSMQSYPLNDGASSPRESSYIAGQNATARHQTLLDTHGGTSRLKLSSNGHNIRSKTSKRKYKHNMRGGESTNRTTVSTQPIVGPSFNTGNDISPVNPTSLSQSANILKLQSGANSANDCYATGSCISQSGGQPVFANWRDAYPAGSFGKEMTGGRRRRSKRNK